MDKEKEIQEMAHIVGKIKYGFFAGCEDESCGDCYIYRVDIDCGYLKQAEQLYLAGYRKAKEVRRSIVIDMCADLFRFLFPDEKRQCDMHDIVEFCDKWYVKVGLPPYNESTKEKYKSEIIDDE